MQSTHSSYPILVHQPIGNLIQQARKGVIRRQVDEIARLVGLTDIEMARILNMSVRGLHGKTATESLNLSASERLLLLERLVQHGLLVFDRRADLLGRWLRTPLPELAYREDNNTDEPQQTGSISLLALGSFSEPIQPVHQSTEQQYTSEKETLIPQTPLSVLDTVSGFSLVDDVLGRIEWGIVG